MVVKRKNSEEKFDLTNPIYGKFDHCTHYGWLTLTKNNRLLFFHMDYEEMSYEDVTDEYEII
jgi:hypothetical protein